MLQKIKTALVSVSDKSNLEDILKTFKKYNIKIISSGGTYKTIKKLGFKQKISLREGLKKIIFND